MPVKKTTKKKPVKQKVAKKKTAAKKPVKEVTKKKTKKEKKPKYVSPHADLIGRPTMLNNVIRDKFVLLLRQGSYIETACDFIGINQDVYYDWMRKGKNPKSGIYYEFAVMVKRARGYYEHITLLKIDRAADAVDAHGVRRQSALHKWRLERMFPKKWGQKKSIEIIQEDLSNPEIDLTTEEAEEIMGGLDLSRYKKEKI